MRRAVVVSAVSSLMLTICSPAWASGPVIVKTSVSPGFIYFADVVTARVDVLFDPARVSSGSIRVNPSFGQWQELGPARTSSTGDGTLVRRTWTFTIACLTIACLPKGTDVQSFSLPPLTVDARAAGGAALALHQRWPTLNVAGRFLPPANGNVSPQLRLQTGAPGPTYRLSPGPLALVLDLVGALVIGSGLVLAAWEIALRRAARREVDLRSPLARALALVRQAQRRDVDDRRRAAGLLARTLPDEGIDLSGAASEGAWSATQPSPGSLEALLTAVEAELEEPS